MDPLTKFGQDIEDALCPDFYQEEIEDEYTYSVGANSDDSADD